MCFNNFLPFLFLITGVQAQSKMIAEYAPAGRRLSDKSNIAFLEESRSVVFLEHCKPDNPVVFPLSAGKGKGFIGLMDNIGANITLRLNSDQGRIHCGKAKLANIFSVVNDHESDGTLATHFVYRDIPGSGGEATISCSETVTLLIAYKDHTNFALAYEVTTKSLGNETTSATGSVVLVGQKAGKKLKATAFTKTTNGKRRLQDNTFVEIHDESEEGVEFDSEVPGEVVLVQVETEDPFNGNKVYRSIITETQIPPKEIRPIKIGLTEVDESGDLHLFFDGLPDGYLLVKALISVQIDGKTIEDHIELKAMTNDGRLILHGGWIRKALDNATTRKKQSWQLVVTEAIALDPENTYVIVAELPPTSVTGMVITRNEHLLSEAPTEEEKQVSDYMKSGRPPPDAGRRLGGRGLQESHKKILVHGYCATGSPFPINEFTDAVAFSSPDHRRRLGEVFGKNNWSHDEFARRIRDFASSSGIVGCGIIAHSQGGAAALHLLTYYWSCLDNADRGGDKLIQSVGTPYRGTALAGTLASIGDVFRAGCGSNHDLTESGADTWLAHIPARTRQKVNYYTTSFTSRWWTYDFCNPITDAFLAGPADGTVAQARGQLPGGNNLGHTTGWCHTILMRDPPQCLDSGRNRQMNVEALF